jgi:undecaprenyl-diphosphatase
MRQNIGMSIFQAIVLGIVQGLTEFLPISSTAHLAIVPALLGWPDPGADFTAIIQLGTMLAVLIYFARDLRRIAVAFVRDASKGTPFASQDARLAWLVGLGTIPIAICGFVFQDWIRNEFRSLWVIATSMIALAVALAIAERFASHTKAIHDIGWVEGLAVGAAQALALVPGSSRSGTTMTAALFAGLTREAAARFSFLLSVPAVLLSGLYEAWEARNTLIEGETAAILTATAVSFAVGYASIAFLLHYLRTHTTFVFVVYRLAVGVAIIALLMLGVLPD